MEDIALFSAFLVAGLVLGRKSFLPSAILRRSQVVLSGVVFSLIFYIGFEMGRLEDLVGLLLSTSYRAIAASSITTLCSALLCALAMGVSFGRGRP